MIVIELNKTYAHRTNQASTLMSTPYEDNIFVVVKVVQGQEHVNALTMEIKTQLYVTKVQRVKLYVLLYVVRQLIVNP